MMQFLGNIEAKIDTKGRVFVPAAFRKILQSSAHNTLILRKDIFQDCLVLYPVEVWDNEVAELRSRLSRWNMEEQALLRQFVVDAEKLEIDGSGRILISKRYCQMIGITSEVRFLGVDNTIEIWVNGSLDKSLLPADDFASRIQALMNKDSQNN
ncbi:division/cell wall cluster transcriptional repressor MraZ [Prevotella sp. 10(H)]|uniref:division/cell wall cluster transcriptional repressor MraZ n=1 Tax=Prevotella sp. 10(H) TaxID=1158294 RepID=UPI0004A6C982|nr:division/cell wall cluster transcriptional repressor MraZ [Prevotella sp. 10(H)]